MAFVQVHDITALARTSRSQIPRSDASATQGGGMLMAAKSIPRAISGGEAGDLPCLIEVEHRTHAQPSMHLHNTKLPLHP